MAGETWGEREQPVLEAIAVLEDQLPRRHDLADDRVAVEAGLDHHTCLRTLRNLIRAGYVRATDAGGLSGDAFMGIELEERGRRAIGQWPSTEPADAFVRALDGMLAVETNPDERGRLQRLRDAAADVAKQALAGAVVVAGETLLR